MRRSSAILDETRSESGGSPREVTLLLIRPEWRKDRFVCQAENLPPKLGLRG